MSEIKVNEGARAKDMASYLLAARAKQITRLKEDVAGLEEALHLSEAIISLLALALAEDVCAREGVRPVLKKGEDPAIFVSGRALAEALRCWCSDTQRHDDGYLITFHQVASKG